MTRKRKILVTVLGLFFLLVFGAFTFVLYCESRGLPEFVREPLLAKLTEAGLDVEVGRIRAGLVTGLEIEDLVWRDGQLGDRASVRLERVHADLDRAALLRGEWPFRQFSCTGGTLRVPLDPATVDPPEDPGDSPDAPGDDPPDQPSPAPHGATPAAPEGEALLLEDLSVDFAWSGQGLTLHSFRARLEGIELHLNAEVPAAVINGDEPAAGEPGGWPFSASRQATIAPLLADLPPSLLPAWRRFRDVCESRTEGSVMELRATVRYDEQLTPRFDLELLLSRLLYRGLLVDSLTARGEWTGSELYVPQFAVSIGRGEYLRGDLRYDLATDRLEAAVASRCYPRKALRALAPAVYASVQGELPRFASVPPQLQLRLSGGLFGAGDLQADVDFSLRDAVFRELPIQQAAGRCRLGGGVLTVEDLQARVDGETGIAGHVRYDLNRELLRVDGRIDGSPLFLTKVSNDPDFPRNFRRIWRDFRWAGTARPSFVVSVTLDLSQVPTPVQVIGRVRMESPQYKGLQFDYIEADVHLNRLEHWLIVDNLQVSRHGRVARGRLLYRFPADYDRYEFEVDSSLDLPLLLGAVRRDWPARVAGWQLAARDLHVVGSGVAMIPKQGREQVSLQGTFTSGAVSWTDYDIHQVAGSFTYEDEVLSVLPTAARLESPDYFARKLTDFSIRYDGKDWQLATHAREAETKTLAGNDVTLRLTVPEEGELAGHITCAAVRGRPVELPLSATEFAARLDFGPEVLRLRDGRAKTLQWQELRLQNPTFSVELRDGGRRLKGWVEAAAASQPNKFQAGQIRVEGAWQGGKLAAEGTADTFESELFAASVRDLVVKGARSDGAELFIEEVTASQVRCFQDYQLEAVTAKLATRGQILDIALDLGLLVGPDELRAEQVQATLVWDDERQTCSFVLSGKQAKNRLGQLQAPQAEGQFSGRSADFVLRAADATYDHYPFADLTCEVWKGPNQLWLRQIRADFFGGRLSGELLVDQAREDNKARVTALGVDLARLMRHLAAHDPDPRPGGQPMEPLPGRLDAELWVGLTPDQPADTFRLDGVGHATIRDSQLWEVPIVKQVFGLMNKLFGRIKLGAGEGHRVTRLDTDLLFQGDRIQFVNAQTDGSVVALEGEGHYWWRTTGIDVRIRPVVLKRSVVKRILSILPNPFKEVVQYRVRGPLKNAEWEALSGVGDLLGGRKAPRDPTLPPLPERDDD